MNYCQETLQNVRSSTSQPRRENSQKVSKHRPISLINIGGKVLEKLNTEVYTNQ